MTTEALKKIRNLAAADHAAKTQFGSEALSSPIATCPARQPDIFVVPSRYAMAEQGAEHADFAPPCPTRSHPMALRRLRAGYVYLWHAEGPLQRYAVAEDGLLLEQPVKQPHAVLTRGELAGIALKKNTDAWMLYSERPLSEDACERLKKDGQRRLRMRHVGLTEIAKTLCAKHCPPLSEAPELVAELMPSVRDRALAHDYQENGASYREGINALGKVAHASPTPDNINAYIASTQWLDEFQSAAERQPPGKPVEAPGTWSATPWALKPAQAWLDTAHQQSGPLYAVFAALDDDLGVLQDINHEQESVEVEHEQWVADNNLRLSVGGFIRSLITEDWAELASALSYRYKDRNITFTPDQGRIILDAQHQLDDELRAETRARQYGGRPGHAEAAVRDARIARILAPVRAFIPADLYSEAECLVREYRAEKQANLDNKFLSAKVDEYIDLEAMNTWLETTAPLHFEQIEQRHQTLFTDREAYLKRSSNGTWFVDYNDLDTRHWLTEMATGCLTAQCIRTQGAEQYADYVRAADGGALTHLFRAWTPSIDAGINTTTRLGELMAALASENIAATQQALAPLTAPILDDVASMARDADNLWSILVNRLAASLLLLKGDKTFSSSWFGVFITARLGSDARLQAVTESGRQVWKLLGQKAEGISHWASATGKAIGAGHVAGILNSPAVVNSGGVVPLAALLLNTLNASNYSEQAAAVERMDEQRVMDAASASLYAAAALVAVVDVQVRKGRGIETLIYTKRDGRIIKAPTLTLFGAVIGALSGGAALAEFKSLQIQLEASQTHTDPWLSMRKTVVTAQIAAYGAHALMGFSLTVRVLASRITVQTAIMFYTLWAGPLNWIIAILGVLYLITWYFQQTPMQNFLNFCCWSKARAGNLGPIAAIAQERELDALYSILYTPRVSMVSSSVTVGSTGPSGVAFQSAINALTVDLPGAEPSSVYLQLSMAGDPIDTQASRDLIKNSPHSDYKPPRPWRDLAPYWLKTSACSWIPFQEGQGLRLSGAFKPLANVFNTPPSTLFLRLRYRTPLIAMLGGDNFVGGARGVAFTLNDNAGVIQLRDDPTPELDRVKIYPLGNGQPGSIYLQLKEKK